jgi:hypothetical protein
MHTFRFLFPVAMILLTACGSDSTTSDSDSVPVSVTAADTGLPDTVPSAALALSMRGDTIAPAERSLIFYSFTSDLVNKKGRALAPKEIRSRFMPLDPLCDGEAIYKLQRLFFLDSLERRGEEPDPDIGQLASVKAALLDTIRSSANGYWVTWRIDYATTEACPYASGTLFMLSTYDAAGKNIATQCMARNEGGADAPISWSCVEVCNIFEDGSFRSLYADTTEDYDANDKPVYSVMRKTFTGQISSAGKITRTELEIERSE